MVSNGNHTDAKKRFARDGQTLQSEPADRLELQSGYRGHGRTKPVEDGAHRTQALSGVKSKLYRVAQSHECGLQSGTPVAHRRDAVQVDGDLADHVAPQWYIRALDQRALGLL